MDEIDAELTRKAVEEIMQDVRLHREREERPQQERKMNPLGRTNKRFLGRTLNAMVQHNKRADEQSRRNCNRKLEELDERRYKRQTRKRSRSPLERKHSRHRKDTSDTSTSEAESYRKYKKKHKKSKTKKKKKKKRHNSRSRSSSSLSTNEQQEESQAINNYYCYNVGEEDVVPSVPFFMAPTMMDIEMQQFYQYKALMALGVAAAQAASNNTVQIIELQSSSPSLSDIKLDDSTTCSEEDNDGAILTINVTDSDDDEDVSKKVPFVHNNSSIETIECDTISVNSVSSVESTVNAIDLTED